MGIILKGIQRMAGVGLVLWLSAALSACAVQEGAEQLLSTTAEAATQAAIKTETEAAEPASVMYTTDGVNLRRSASLQAEVVTTLEPGTKVYYIGRAEDKNWAQVSAGNARGYIYLSYLSDRVPASTAADEAQRTESRNAGGEAEKTAEERGGAQQEADGRGKTGEQSEKSGESAEQAPDKARDKAEGGAQEKTAPKAEKKEVFLQSDWKFAKFSKIYSGHAVLYKAGKKRRGIVVAVNAGHGTKGGSKVKTQCHPDGSPKLTGGTTKAGATTALAVSSGMTFKDGTSEAEVTLREARLLRDRLLEKGYDVLMLRDAADVQLDNVARTVLANQLADCHIAIHWDGDGLDYDKGCFYMSVPDGLKKFEHVAKVWKKSEHLGESLIEGLSEAGNKIHAGGSMDMDLTQTAYSTVPSVDIELGNQSSDYSGAKLEKLTDGLLRGIDKYFSQS